MAKTQTMSIKEFMSGEWKQPSVTKGNILYSANGLVITMQNGDSAFGNMHEAIMNMFDKGVIVVIIFAGASWGLGHRTKAIEILIGICCGYLLARHAVDIRDFLKNI
jgi:hypothetical protein